MQAKYHTKFIEKFDTLFLKTNTYCLQNKKFTKSYPKTAKRTHDQRHIHHNIVYQSSMSHIKVSRTKKHNQKNTKNVKTHGN